MQGFPCCFNTDQAKLFRGGGGGRANGRGARVVFNYGILVTGIVAALFLSVTYENHMTQVNSCVRVAHGDVMITQNSNNTGESTATRQPFLKDCRCAADSLHAV